MRVALLHQHYSRERLAIVTEKMRQIGPPLIRAYYDAPTATWLAQEGTHRLRAALVLGIRPVIVPVRWPRSQAALVRARYAPAHVFSVEVAR